MTADQIIAAGEQIKAAGECAPRLARDPVNQPMINNWVEALGDTNPIYVDEQAARAAGHPGIVAPPAMAQVWTMPGLGGSRPSDDPMNAVNDLLDAAGYTSVVATNCEQTYHRYLRVGERVQARTRLQDLVGPKRTALGEGWFATYILTWYADDEPVTEMSFRMLKFAPGTGKPAAPQEDLSKRVRPIVSKDTEFFWEGAELGELRIQRLPDGTLRHPPVPALWQDKSEAPDYVVASGRGTVFSYVVHHAPKVPGRQLPFVVALVELEEGVRMLGELRGVEPDRVRIDMPVEVAFEKLDDDNTLPYWKVIR
ncbi:bifunctional MaoC family dehydratase N-terminal/OB-fold nucleic acid binding domain-containing protein [Nocardia transvalensis]|uniref:bifunctional MaoC family dehydratase N-terminal/OB-fold nucleic acid binding domain-containing protein n=1 Tax=Nocardia transvalensis TaxID=37333 RepID=UPI001893E70C|nr:bifunctional MaoC family dehydratase N-terminal/OB-fold nucleic acid binding domain-containing protein [Nocardia transvalensis]MBF6332742.1 bifunctional MaoC family dehydratase/OB-fold nucleic acid binding domain-containing protein [Nocardia transvalensis]